MPPGFVAEMDFGRPGEGFVRLSHGTSSALTEEAVRRLAAAVADGPAAGQ